ncbi:GNAT family N-acetyltransferase [Flavihumibacter petaseus]|uniref:Putative acyltransferase n=1 Tax=Flavihumibacter petaseus NBRC 106054 TaxID=1220578 RepID=A0A0E9N5A5_9BACT|nr:GNAT family N-acetyltransferase [Flavihumibacter petaseus]GAO44530.1 putative acyltransferase [Flavihumibacter petaseus NBRC 106054]
MDEITLRLNDKNQGGFFIFEGEEKVAEMIISISGTALTVYHTEVIPSAEGRGLAKKLLAHMVDYARKHGLKVIPLCPYVHAQFKRHPAEYADLWKEE